MGNSKLFFAKHEGGGSLGGRPVLHVGSSETLHGGKGGKFPHTSSSGVVHGGSGGSFAKVIEQSDINNSPSGIGVGVEPNSTRINTDAFGEMSNVYNIILESFDAAISGARDIQNRDVVWEGEVHERYKEVLAGLVTYLEQLEPCIKDFEKVKNTINGKIEGVEGKTSLYINSINIIDI